MKKFFHLLVIILSVTFTNISAHGFGGHAAHLSSILALNDQYSPLLSYPRYQDYFLYGSCFPDMQYQTIYKETLQSLYNKIKDYEYAGVKVFDGLTIETDMSEILSNNVYPFGLDTHDPKYAMKFAEYLLVKAASIRSDARNRLGIFPYTDQLNEQLAFALGYYAHLAEDVACHDFLVPKINAALNLGDLELVKKSVSFNQDPNAQMEGIIETIIDHYYGANESVAQTFRDNIWIVLGPFILEGNTLMVSYDGNPYSDIGTKNPIFDFFIKTLNDFLVEYPDAKKSQSVISYNGLTQLAQVSRFVNQFYPEIAGDGRLDEALARYVCDHLNYSDAANTIGITLAALTAGFLGELLLEEINVEYFSKIAYPYLLPEFTTGLGADARSLVSLMLSDMSTANNLAIQNPDVINIDSFNKLKNSFLFTNPTSLIEPYWNEYKNLGVKIYNEVGPSGKWYSDWSPWNKQSMAWSALSSLNNLLPEIYTSNPNISVYDAYFMVNETRITGPKFESFFENNTTAKVVVELYNTSNVASQNLTLRVKKDHLTTNYNLDVIKTSTTFSIDQDPILYNSNNRIKIELPFSISLNDLNGYQGYYFELVNNANNKVMFTSSFEQYKTRLDLTNNYTKLYGTYDEDKWPISLGFNHNHNHLLTDVQLATGIGSQRKIAKDIYNGYLHEVYTTSDKVWYIYSTDQGTNWSDELPLSNSTYASSPSLAISGLDWGENEAYFVWQELSGGTRNLYIKSMWTIETPLLLDSDATGSDMQPVIAVSSDADKILVVYKKMYSGRYQVHYKYSSNGGSSFSVGGPLSVLGPILWNFPTVAWNSQSNKFMISGTYTESNFISVGLLSYNGSTWTDEGNVYYSTQVPIATPYSQVSVDGTGRTHIVWIGYDNQYQENSAAMHRSVLNGTWSTIRIFRDEVIYDPSIVYASVSGHNDTDGGVSIFYAAGNQNTLFDIYSTNNTSWNGLIYIAPSATIYNPVALEKAAPQAISFVTTKGASSPYEIKTQTKNNSQTGTYTGILKVASGNEASGSGLKNVKLYRRIEIVDTVNNGMLSVQFGNITNKEVTFMETDKATDSFLNTASFDFENNDSLSVEFGIKSKGWKNKANLIFELRDPASGKTISNIGEYHLSSDKAISLNEKKINKIVNRMDNKTVSLGLKIDGLDYKNLIVNYIDAMIFSDNNTYNKSNSQNLIEIGEELKDYDLSQNFPNPFNPTTTISYQLPKAGSVTLKVYDALGKVVRTLVDGYKSEGRYSIEFSANNLASGLYFYELRCGEYVSTKKMILVK